MDFLYKVNADTTVFNLIIPYVYVGKGPELAMDLDVKLILDAATASRWGTQYHPGSPLERGMRGKLARLSATLYKFSSELNRKVKKSGGAFGTESDNNQILSQGLKLLKNMDDLGLVGNYSYARLRLSVIQGEYDQGSRIIPGIDRSLWQKIKVAFSDYFPDYGPYLARSLIDLFHELILMKYGIEHQGKLVNAGVLGLAPPNMSTKDLEKKGQHVIKKALAKAERMKKVSAAIPEYLGRKKIS